MVKFNPEISLGSLISAAVFAGSIASYAVAGISKFDAATASVVAARDVAAKAEVAATSLRNDMNEQFRSVRQEMADQFKASRADYANLPDVRAQMVQHERRINELETQARVAGDRVNDLAQKTTGLQIEYDGLSRVRNPR